MGASETELIEEARAALGDSENILAAGIFGLADLVLAQVAGLAAGSAGGGEIVAGVTGASAPAADGLGAALGGGLGAFAATKAAAEAQGVTVQLIVAVTDDTIHVLNRDTGGRLRTEVASFPRARTRVAVEKFGLSRQLTLTDDATEDSIRLHGSVSWLSAQAAGDKVVLDLLSA